MEIQLTEPPKQNADLIEIQQYAQKQFFFVKKMRVRVDFRALATVDTPGGLFSYANDNPQSILVTRVILDIQTPSSGAATADVGRAATATTLSDNLIDGLDINAAAGVFDNLSSPGANGRELQKILTGEFVTGSIASGASAGLVGNAYIEFFVMED